MILNAEMEEGGGRWGGMKDMRDASSEFDSVMALTSETVTRGMSFLPQRRLPRAAPSSIVQSLTGSIISCARSPGPNWVTFT